MGAVMGGAGGGKVPAEASAVPGPVWRVTGEPLARGAADGPLAGVGVAVKDLYAIAGQRIGAGNPDWLAGAPVEERTARAVQALLDAGAHVTGIAQTDELAFSLNGTNKHYGTPPNPAAPGRVTGGSSNGPAAAVALGLADLGLGTDTAGSVRVPASHCGLYGLRTTHDAVSREGLLGLADSFDTVGWFARDAGLLERAGDVLLPQDEEGHGEDVDGDGGGPVHEFLVAGDVLDLAEPETRAAFEAACGSLRERFGTPPWRRVESLMGGRLEEWFTAFRAVQAAEAWERHGAWIEAHPGSLGPGVTKRFDLARGLAPGEREAGEAVLDEAREVLRAAIEPGTVLLLPAAAAPPPPVDLDSAAMDAYRFTTLRMTSLSSIAGLPALVMPLLRVGGLPVGLCAVGARGTDRSLLRFASEVALAR
ncbi:amidase [Actinomadura viridis]|uniref:Asp-tRNA(Asn)/Glu-tRNA(Gln) amidotransferase A subunit family amidase n=1 Tax=Actinomadura viridis TaxID=58110 RepID=A0A931DI84_9ACTN|nr:amidase [Actinomadura viridis]MBG6091664.1 Asp-tRNA(Asn)/Glu-tRNA(Gln) amidotransferase A subunit family amidase [Actinomadura viridis]